MGDTYFPNDLVIKSLSSITEFNNHSLVQFYHRNLAYFITIYVLTLSLFIYLKKIQNLFYPLLLLLVVLFLQITLGILSLISDLNIYLASAHQITSVILVFTAINLYYFEAK